MSDNKRALWNEAMIMYMAGCRPVSSTPAVVVECGKDEKGQPKDIRGSTAKQHDMTLFKCSELVGNIRNIEGDVSNGCTYLVDDVNSELVSFHLHPDFQVFAKLTTPDIKASLAPWVEEIAKLVKHTPRKFTYLQKHANEELKSLLKAHMGSANQASMWKAFAYNFKDKFEICGDTLCALDTDEELSEDEAFLPETLQLSHKDTCASLRPTYAMCYYSAQGQLFVIKKTSYSLIQRVILTLQCATWMLAYRALPTHVMYIFLTNASNGSC